jgi:hypothetical protein
LSSSFRISTTFPFPRTFTDKNSNSGIKGRPNAKEGYKLEKKPKKSLWRGTPRIGGEFELQHLS